LFEVRPVTGYVVFPGFERESIIVAEGVPVFEDETLFKSTGKLACRGEHRVGKDVFLDPRVVSRDRFVTADALDKKPSIRHETAPGYIEIGAVVFVPDMFEHAD